MVWRPIPEECIPYVGIMAEMFTDVSFNCVEAVRTTLYEQNVCEMGFD